MKNYILGRLVRSIISIFLVVTIAILMVYTLVPRDNVFQNDQMLSKLASKPDEKVRYKYNAWERLGYLEFVDQREMCESASDNVSACMIVNSPESLAVKAEYEAKGWTVESFQQSGLLYAHKDKSVFSLVTTWFGRLIKVDNPWAITDSGNPNLERKIYLGSDHNGVPALKCSGCENKYLIYFDGSFPFIHQNIISLNFGISYPTFNGREVGAVITEGQGNPKQSQVKFETGQTISSPVNLHKCKYKSAATMDSMDQKKFVDNYANCANNLSDPSMVVMSFIFGVLGLIISYGIGLPAGILMASQKDKLADKIGIVYINFMIAVPSLAFIYFAKFLGNSAGLPEKFPTFGAHDIRSYILPTIILGLMSTASLMIWIRRYMIDQSSADYVKFARAKGLSQREIFVKHILRNAIIPIVNGIPSSIILTISGAVITETVFAIPGMGKMLPDAITGFNNPMIIALTFIFTTLSILSLLLGDILVTFVDPRIQLEAKGGSR
ncbi:MAG: ABC transporter permease [Erysipelotrichaceae bacterium]|nr:ABC transporter permease [Erysipelotrichaceae bacterium]